MEKISTYTESTIAQYKHIAAHFEKMFKDSCNDTSCDLPVLKYPYEFAEWVKTLVSCNTWSKRTFEQYRAALIWYYTENRIPPGITEIKKISSIHLNRHSKKTSGIKLKKLPENMLNLLFSRLLKEKGKNDAMIVLWIKAGLYSGLLSREWEQATWNDTENTLVVVNAQTHQYYKIIGYRNIIYDKNNHKDEILTIKSFIDKLNALKNSHKFVYNDFLIACRKRLFSISKQLFPKRKVHFTLDTPRYLFIKNMKNAGLTKTQISLLIGNTLEKKVSCHYPVPITSS